MNTFFDLDLVLIEDVQYNGSDSLGDRFVRAVADLFQVMYFSQTAHWNIQGPDFQQYHALFQESYEVSYDAIDDAAEQARILGVRMPGSLSELLQTSSAPLSAGEAPTAMHYFQQLQRCHEMMQMKWDDIAANDGGNAGVNDFASAMSGKHAKMAWKFRSLTTGSTS